MSVAPAVVLLSGGVDSATTAAIAQRDGFDVHALSFRYGQRHAVELDAAAAVARQLGVREHRVVDVDLRAFGGSALTDDIAVPKGRHIDADDVPVTYVPARNTIFLSFALAYAEVIGSSDVFLGVNAVDYSGYPDCRPEFVAAFEVMARLATKAGVEGRQHLRVHAPLITFGKADIIRTAVDLGVDLAATISCYDPSDDGGACGACDACQLRREGFVAAGVADVTRYASLAS